MKSDNTLNFAKINNGKTECFQDFWKFNTPYSLGKCDVDGDRIWSRWVWPLMETGMRLLTSCVSSLQMSGHAGRRGEDLTGSVFFYNIPLPKTEQLLRSNVPELNDQFPLSLSLVLRCMLLVAKADDKEDANAKVLIHVSEDLTQLNK